MRKTKEGVIGVGVRRLEAALSLEPRFPEARAEMDGIRGLATFAHPGQLISREVWGNHVWFEILRRTGFAERNQADAEDRSVAAPGFQNMPYSYGNPHSQFNPHPPGYHKIALGKFPTILDSDRPYFTQSVTRSIDFRDMQRTTIEAFSGSASVAGRLDRVLDALEPLQFKENEEKNVIGAALSSRRKLLNLMGVDHIREEIDSSDTLRRFANILEIMDKVYGEPFYRLPISRTLIEAGGYLKAIGANGKREKVAIEEKGFGKERYPVVSYTDPAEMREIRFAGDEVYEAIRQGKLVPTMVTLIFGLMVAPQVPQLGGRDMHEYAPQQIRLLGKHLGLERHEYAPLFITTLGYDIFQLSYTYSSIDRRTKPPTRSQKDAVTTHVPPAIVAFGEELIHEALARDAVVKGTYGKEGGRVVELQELNMELAHARR